jgi:hypothetical protein
MAQIMPKDKSWGETIGEGLGQGIGSGFQALANMKMQDYAARQAHAREQQFAEEQSKRLQPQFGDKVSQVPFMSKEMRGPVMSHMFAEMKKQQRIGQSAQMWKGFGLPDNMAMAIASSEPAVQKSILDRLEGLSIPMNGQNTGQPTQGTGFPGQPNQNQIVPGEENGSTGAIEQQPGLTIGANSAERRFRAQMEQQKKFHDETMGVQKLKLAAHDQEHVDELAKPTLEYFRNTKPVAEKAMEIINNMQALLDTGKVESDVTEAGFEAFPLSSRSDETQQFDALGTELASLNTQSQKGQPTGFKMKWEKSIKPSIFKSKATQQALLNNNADNYSKILLGNRALGNAIENNAGYIPRNLDNIINKQVHEYKKSGPSIRDVYKNIDNLEKEKTGSAVVASQNTQQPPTNTPPTTPSAKPEESGFKIVGDLARLPIQMGSRFVSGMAGGYADTADLGMNLANYLTRGTIPTYNQVQGKLPISLPTSEQGDEAIQKVTGGYTKPRSELEKTFGDYFSLAGSIFGLGGIKNLVKGIYKGGPALVDLFKVAQKTVKIAAFGEGAQYAVKKAGAGESVQKIAKLGGVIMGAAHGSRDILTNTKDELYTAGETLLKDIKTTSEPIVKDLLNIEKEITSGTGGTISNSRKNVLDILNNVKEYFKGPEINATTLVDAKKQLNEVIHTAAKNEKPYLYRIKDALMSGLDEAGQQSAAAHQGVQYVKMGDEIHGALATGQTLRDMYNNLPKDYVKNNLTKMLFFAAGGAGSAKIPGVLTKAAIGVGSTAMAIPTFNALKALSKSKIVRQGYMQSIKGSLLGDTEMFKKGVTLIDKAIKK